MAIRTVETVDFWKLFDDMTAKHRAYVECRVAFNMLKGNLAGAGLLVGTCEQELGNKYGKYVDARNVFVNYALDRKK